MFWRDWRYRTNEASVQIVQHVPFVPIYAHTATFPSIAHLSIFATFASVFSDPFDQARFPFLIDLHILLFWTFLQRSIRGGQRARTW